MKTKQIPNGVSYVKLTSPNQKVTYLQIWLSQKWSLNPVNQESSIKPGSISTNLPDRLLLPYKESDLPVTNPNSFIA